MALTELNRDLGTKQGRIQPQGWLTPEGSYVFVLGYDTPGHIASLNTGDYIEVYNSSGVGSSEKLMRIRVKFRKADQSLPAGAAWKLEVKVAGVVIWSKTFGANARTRDFRDIAINVSRFTLPGDFGVRLTLVAA